ncbi:MAG: dTMP kinase [Candidatus Diapherotrites archaeon]|uniref:Probable thymidylate kinase n=1 Tax=Candidatus Iainarchaeum sp. TaxID=3101447 RepID=A0A938YX21_9ARCH|nr:dTMP kinase [Candidatus Diapherotrites archaeon]
MVGGEKGLFIVFDGIDGSGKTENILKTANYFLDKSKGFDSMLLTREPTNSKYGQAARELQKTDKDPLAHAQKCLELYVKDRKDHLENVINPNLEQGAVVLCDRYKYVTYAYQLVQGNKLEVIDNLHNGLREPDLTFIFDLPAEVAWMRIKGAIESETPINITDSHSEITRKANGNGRVQKEKFENLEFLRNSREVFRDMKTLFPNENIEIINSNQSREKVFMEIKKRLDKLLSL